MCVTDVSGTYFMIDHERMDDREYDRIDHSIQSDGRKYIQHQNTEMGDMHDGKRMQEDTAVRRPCESRRKMIDFYGWLLPVQYSSILKEHENVRTRAGLFDVSHMGEIEVSGSDAFEFLQYMLTNDITARPGKAVYSPMCYADGVLSTTLLSISKAKTRFYWW